MNHSLQDLPSVTATMLTGHDPRRRVLAEMAVESFVAQTYANRELLILNTGQTLGVKHPNVRELLLPHPPTLGALRNMAIEQACGDLLINWDDDDWCHPRRIEEQVAAYRPGHLVLLRSQVRLNLITGASVAVDWNHGIYGTMLWPKNEHRFPLLNQGEDTLFVESYAGKRIVWRNAATLYIRTYHGSNVCSEGHVMNPKGARALEPGDVEFVYNQVLRRFRNSPLDSRC